MLGTEAVYRVCAVDQRRAQVEVEVVQAPGLRTGQRFSFELATVRGMAVLQEAADFTPPPAED